MAFTPGFQFTLGVTLTDVAALPADDIGGAENLNPPLGLEDLETTSGNQTAGERSRIMGLYNRGPITFSCNLDEADTGQSRLFTALNGRTLVYLTALPDGTNGYRYPGFVTKADRSSDSRAKNMVAFEFQPSGAPTAIP